MATQQLRYDWRLSALAHNMERVCCSPCVARLTAAQYEDLVTMREEVRRLLEERQLDDATRVFRFARNFVASAER